MRNVLVIALFIVSLAFGKGLSGIGAATCPENVKIRPGAENCRDVCGEIGSKHFQGYELRGAIGTERKIKSDDGVAFVPARCSCVYELRGEGVDLPLKTVNCEYAVSFSASGGQDLKLNMDIELPQDTPTKLVKTMSFRMADPGLGGGAGIVFAGLYAAYVNAVKGIAAGVALFVVIVVAGFFVLANVSERFFDFMRDRIRYYFKDAGVEVSRKFAYTSLAIIFFSLPVPATSPMVKLNNARSGDGEQMARDCERAFGVIGGGGSSQTPEEEENRQYRERAIQECRKLAQTVEDGRIYLPVAVALVSGLIDWGTNMGKRVGKISEEVTKAYMHYKISASYHNLRLLYENDEYKRMREQILEEAQAKSKPIETLGCVVKRSGDVCADYRAMAPSEKAERIIENHMCKKVFDQVRISCDATLGSATGIAQQIIEAANNQQSTTISRAEAFQSVSNSLNGLSRSLTWLSPATVPLSLFFFQTALLVPPDKPPPHAVATLMTEESGWVDDVKMVKEIVEKGITDAVNDAQKVLGMVSWGDIIHGNNRTQTAFNLGYIMGFVSVPPGSIFQGMLEKVFASGGEAAAGLFQKLYAMPGLGRVLELLSRTSGSAASDVVATAVAFVLAHSVIDTIPLIAAAVPVIFKFIGYLMEIAKFIINLPFYASLAATRRFESETLSFFPIAIRLMLTPAVIALAPLFGFVGAELTIFFLYKIPVYIIAQGLQALSVGSVLVAFVLGNAIAIMYVAATVAAVIIGWESSKGFIDGIFEILQRVIGYAASSVSREIAGAIAVLRMRLAMA